MKSLSLNVDESAGEAFPDDEARWQAVLRKDHQADGHFLFAVKTAGVFCRPVRPERFERSARACASNGHAVAIACHRVVRSDGKASGYRWGVERKRTLLQGKDRDTFTVRDRESRWFRRSIGR